MDLLQTEPDQFEQTPVFPRRLSRVVSCGPFISVSLRDAESHFWFNRSWSCLKCIEVGDDAVHGAAEPIGKIPLLANPAATPSSIETNRVLDWVDDNRYFAGAIYFDHILSV